MPYVICIFEMYNIFFFLVCKQNFIRDLPLLNYPNVCTNSPQFGKAFCTEHVMYLNEKHPEVPTDIRGFLKHCGIKHDNTGTC